MQYRTVIFWRKTLLILVILAGLFGSITAAIKHEFTLGSSVASEHYRDQQASPLAYRGLCVPLHIRHTAYARKSQHSIQIDFRQTRLQSNRHSRTEDLRFNIYYQYLRNTGFGYQNLTAFLGAGFDYGMYQGQYKYNSYSLGENFLNNTFALTLDGSVLMTLSPTSHFDASISLPLFAYVIRSGYAYTSPDRMKNDNDYSWINFLRSGNWISWNSFRSLGFDLNWRQRLSRHFGLELGYQFQYQEYLKPRIFRFGSNRFHLGIIVRL
jgi:hypothetical protein